MSFQTFVTQQLASINTALNNLATNAKRIFELPEQTTLVTTSWIHVDNAGVSQKLQVQKIIAGITQTYIDRVIYVGELVIVENDVTVPEGVQAIINSINYFTTEDFTFNIPFSDTGKSRIDIIIMDSSAQLSLVTGVETVGVAVRPNIPLNSVLVTQINVTEDSFNAVEGVLFKGEFDSPEQLNEAHPTAISGSYAIVNTLEESLIYFWSVTNATWFTPSAFSSGRTPRISPEGPDDCVFELADKSKQVFKKGNGDFFLNAGIFSPGHSLIFDVVIQGWGGGVSFGENININGTDYSVVQGEEFTSVGISSNERGYLYFMEKVGDIEYWIYRTIKVTYEGGTTPGLQEVTTAGATTDKDVTFQFGDYHVKIYNNSGQPMIELTDGDGNILRINGAGFDSSGTDNPMSVYGEFVRFINEASGDEIGQFLSQNWYVKGDDGTEINMGKNKFEIIHSNGFKKTITAATPTGNGTIVYPDVGSSTKTLATQDYADDLITQLINSAPSDANTLKELNDKILAINAIIGGSAPDGNSLVDTVAELLAVFSTYPEGTDVYTILTGKINSSDIINNLTQVVTGKVLDAAQGKVLKDLIDALTSVVSGKQDSLNDSNFGTFASSLGSKGTPVDADSINISDSADSNKQKKTTLTQFKAFLKTYFDTLYQAVLTDTVFGTLIASWTGKTTPVDADTITVSDSADSSKAKKVSLTNLWSNYFKGKNDTRYVRWIVKDAVTTTGVSNTLIETILSSYRITGGTFGSNDIMNIVSARFKSAGAGGTITYRIYVNTTNSLSGAVQIAAIPQSNTAMVTSKIANKSYTFSGGNLEGVFGSSSTGIDSGNSTTALSSTALNPASDFYIIVTAQLGTSNSNNAHQTELYITN